MEAFNPKPLLASPTSGFCLFTLATTDALHTATSVSSVRDTPVNDMNELEPSNVTTFLPFNPADVYAGRLPDVDCVALRTVAAPLMSAHVCTLPFPSSVIDEVEDASYQPTSPLMVFGFKPPAARGLNKRGDIGMAVRSCGDGVRPGPDQLLNITKPVVPVLLVVDDTIFRNSVPKTSSGRL